MYFLKIQGRTHINHALDKAFVACKYRFLQKIKQNLKELFLQNAISSGKYNG